MGCFISKQYNVCVFTCCRTWTFVIEKVRGQYFAYDGKSTENISQTEGRQKGNKCLNYVAGEKQSECEGANIFFFSISLWKTWSHLKGFTARINLRDVSSPSASVALGPRRKGSQHRSLCYCRATDNTPPSQPATPGLSGPLATRANGLATRSDWTQSDISHIATGPKPNKWAARTARQ